jgi:type I restriction enzyme S subunit
MIQPSIPANWRWSTLEGIAAPVPNAIVDGPFGSSLKLEDYVQSGVPVLQGKNITADAFRWIDVRFISDRKAEELARSSVRLGDILIVKIGSIGYSAIVDDLNGFDRAIIPANLAKLTPDRTRIEDRYLIRWLTSPAAKEYLVRSASKTAQPALSLGKIRSLPLPLPPLPEQQRIAKILDAADALRAKRRAALAQLDTLAQAIFLDMFGDPANNPKSFPTTPLSRLIRDDDTINYGVVQPGDDLDEGVPLVRVGDLQAGAVRHTALKRISPEIEAKYGRSRLRGDEVLVSCVGTIGVIAMADDSVRGFNIARAVARIPLAIKSERTFIAEFLRTGAAQRYFTNELRTVSQPTLNIKQLSELSVMLPPLPLQQVFARRAAAVEKLKAAHRASLAELDALFASLQHRAFRGEL